MTDCTSLAGKAAASYSANDVKLLSGLGSFQRLTNDQLQGVQTKVVVEGTIVDGDFTSTARNQTNSCNRGLSSAGAVEICFLRCVHDLISSL